MRLYMIVCFSGVLALQFVSFADAEMPSPIIFNSKWKKTGVGKRAYTFSSPSVWEAQWKRQWKRADVANELLLNKCRDLNKQVQTLQMYQDALAELLEDCSDNSVSPSLCTTDKWREIQELHHATKLKSDLIHWCAKQLGVQ